MHDSYEAALREFVRNGGTSPARIGWEENGNYHESQVFHEEILRVRPLVKCA
jgi:hypothetical protein